MQELIEVWEVWSPFCPIIQPITNKETNRCMAASSTYPTQFSLSYNDDDCCLATAEPVLCQKQNPKTLIKHPCGCDCFACLRIVIWGGFRFSFSTRFTGQSTKWQKPVNDYILSTKQWWPMGPQFRTKLIEYNPCVFSSSCPFPPCRDLPVLVKTGVALSV